MLYGALKAWKVARFVQLHCNLGNKLLIWTNRKDFSEFAHPLIWSVKADLVQSVTPCHDAQMVGLDWFLNPVHLTVLVAKS